MLVEASQRRERALEPVGGHVVRERTTPGDRERSAPGVVPVAAKQRGGAFAIAASRPPYEVSVRRFKHSSAVWYEPTAFARPGTGILPA
jgi:hypothetical protein